MVSVERIFKYKFTCDGQHPRGGQCPCNLVLEATSQTAAETKARTLGWRDLFSGTVQQPHQIWLCNAGDGHR